MTATLVPGTKSGVSVQISGEGVLVSGQTVVLASGTTVVMSGVNVIIQSGTIIVTQAASGEALRISGQYVQISGQGVLVASGLYVYQAPATQSGTYIIMSGQGVIVDYKLLSGLYVQVSGQGVAVASGLYVYQAPATQSGTYIIMSGQGVTIASGLYVQISGQGIALQSGVYVNIGSGVGVTAALSWASTNMVSVGSGISYQMSGANVVASVSVGSGLGVVQASGAIIIQSGYPSTMTVMAGMYRPEMSGAAALLTSGMIAPPSLSIDGDLRVEIDTTDSSGLRVVIQSGVGVLVASGLYVYQAPATQSGTYIIMSGQGVTIASGLYVQISGQGVIVASGVNITANPSGGIRTRNWLKVTANSGGVALVSGVVQSVVLKSLATSGDFFIGGNATIDMPYSGYGIALGASEAITLDVGNFNLIKVCASISGDMVSYLGIT